jgi:hypothetical protein
MHNKLQLTNEDTKSSTDEDLEEIELFIKKKKVQNQAFQKIIENLTTKHEISKQKN